MDTQKLFLHIQLAEELNEIAFHKPILNKVQSSLKNIQTFDIDNFSDASLVQSTLSLLERYNHVIILIEAKPQAKLNYLRAFFTNFIENPRKLKILLSGNNEGLEKILSILNYQRIQENTQETDLIQTIHSEFSLNK